MDEKELFRSLNGVSYSDEEIQEYIDLGKLTDNDIANISGAVKTQLGYEGIKKSNEIVINELEEDEKIEQIVKVRNIRAIKVLTASSMIGGTMGASMDYTVFDNMYFTNKKVYFVDTNVINQPLNHKSRNLDEIVGIRFTNNIVKLEKDESGELTIKIVRDKVKLVCIIISILSCIYFGICISLKIDPDPMLVFTGCGTVIWTILKSIQDLWLDRIKIAMKDGYVWDILIASYDYKKCRNYLVKLAKRFK